MDNPSLGDTARERIDFAGTLQIGLRKPKSAKNAHEKVR